MQTEKQLIWPMVTVMIATFNSAKILERVLIAIGNQDYPREKLEILAVDGGSTDDTRKIAASYGCRILDNPKTEPVNAKLIGLRSATGQYYITLDHDEVMVNTSSIRLKVEALMNNPACHAAICSGYKSPKDYPLLNQYISVFGDPLSLFLYHYSKGVAVQEKLLRRYKILRDERDYMVVDFSNVKKQPLYELICAGTMIDRAFFLKMFPNFDSAAVVAQLFYIMLEHGYTQMIFIKNDSLLHYSADSLRAYFPKLKWRICNNVHFPEKGELGYTGRVQYQRNIRYKKYLFIPYAFTIIFPLCEGIVLALKRKNPIFMMHPIFCLYVGVEILWQYALKLMHITPAFRSYDGKKKIER
ncbi:MAG: glycosyltransferase family 2 protein [Ruthenibacterium sp.]